jgi:hypothetical protein
MSTSQRARLAIFLAVVPLLIAGSGCLAAELPKCNDSLVLDTLTELDKKAAKAKLNNYQVAKALIAQVMMTAVAQGKDRAQVERELGVSPGSRGLPDLTRFVRKLSDVYDSLSLTYSNEQEVRFDGYTKYCAAVMRIRGTSLLGDPIDGTGQVTYTIQLTESGGIYVQGTGGGDFE